MGRQHLEACSLLGLGVGVKKKKKPSLVMDEYFRDGAR